MNARNMAWLFAVLMAAHAAANEPVSVAEQNGPTIEDLALNVLDPQSGLSIVGTITAQDNTKIAGTNKLTDPRAMAYFEGGEVGVAGTLLPEENQNVAGDAEYAGGISIEDGICLAGSQLNDRA